MQPEMRYIELKTGYNDDGPAWIARVTFSKTGRTVYFNGRKLQRLNVGSGNHYDKETLEDFWVSGVKKSGSNRHTWGRGKIMVQRDVLEEFLAWTGQKTLNTEFYELVE